jgi:hypothetical protein
MEYQYDLQDFKLFLFKSSAKNRVDGLTVWIGKIPLPIDLFNRIFNDADILFIEYARQLTVATIVFSEHDSFKKSFGISANDLPSKKLINRKQLLVTWLSDHIKSNKSYHNLFLNIVDTLGLNGFKLDERELANSLCHQGRKYSRLAYPSIIKPFIEPFHNSSHLGSDKTDMFGNIIADIYNIYRSGFSDALAIVFNALLDFRLICFECGSSMQRIILTVEKSQDLRVSLNRTKDGSLWQPGYEDDHIVNINPEHPFFKTLNSNDVKHITDLLYFLSEFENNQFGDAPRKIIENMRQEVSRSLWIKHD